MWVGLKDRYFVSSIHSPRNCKQVPDQIDLIHRGEGSKVVPKRKIANSQNCLRKFFGKGPQWRGQLCLHAWDGLLCPHQDSDEGGGHQVHLSTGRESLRGAQGNWDWLRGTRPMAQAGSGPRPSGPGAGSLTTLLHA